MKYVWQIIVGASIGITVGFLIALGFSLSYGADTFMPSSTEFVAQFSNNLTATAVSAGLWAMMGIVFDLCSYLVFGRENWSITKQTVVHFIVTIALFTPLAIAAGWFPVQSYLIFYFIEFVIIYIIVWFISMQIAKQKVRRLNQLVNESKGK